MPTDMDRENVLTDFAMEGSVTPEVLKTYIQRFPELALELTDLFHEFTMADVANAAGSILGEEHIASKEVSEGLTKVQAALSREGLRDLARRLELPRDFVAGFRDARVRLGSVPSSVVLNLARAIDVKTQYFVAYLQGESGTARAMAFKADLKPQTQAVQEYEQFIESLGLDAKEVAALARLAGSCGRD